MYITCIKGPPNPEACPELYATYLASLVALNSGHMPGFTKKKSGDNYTSVYDVCRFDIAHFLFDNKSSSPYCQDYKDQ